MRLVEIPFLTFNKIAGKVWSSVRWKRLNRGEYKSQSEWVCAKFEIDERDSAYLRDFNFSTIKKYEEFEKALSEMFKGDFISVINYDEGLVYIVAHKGVDIKYNDYRKIYRKGIRKKRKARLSKLPGKLYDEVDMGMKSVKAFLDTFPFLHPELKRLYDKGLNDRYISKKIREKFLDIKFDVDKVLYWRRLYNLPANKTFHYTCRIDEKTESDMLGYYKKGLNDLEIGIAMGINPGKIAVWRHRNNLEANRKRIPVSKISDL